MSSFVNDWVSGHCFTNSSGKVLVLISTAMIVTLDSILTSSGKEMDSG